MCRRGRHLAAYSGMPLRSGQAHPLACEGHASVIAAWVPQVTVLLHCQLVGGGVCPQGHEAWPKPGGGRGREGEMGDVCVKMGVVLGFRERRGTGGGAGCQSGAHKSSLMKEGGKHANKQ